MSYPTLPLQLRDRYRVWGWSLVSHPVPESVTYRLSRPGSQTRYLKLCATSFWPTPRDEYLRFQWAGSYLPVPDVIECGKESDVAWIITGRLDGVDATSDLLGEDTGSLVDLLAEGLCRFHTAPVRDCPFDFTLDAALAHVRRRASAGAIDPIRDFHPEHADLTVSAAIDRLVSDRPLAEDLVVCHGDYCLPNVLVDRGRVTGFVDLGELGVADRWWDLAVATWSVSWNLGEGYEDRFLAAYGIERDSARIAYYRLLYDLVS